MTIQGIVCGYADPKKVEINVLIVGRGDNYVLLLNGKPEVTFYSELDAAFQAFERIARVNCSPHWRTVLEVRSNNVSNLSEVVALGSSRFDERSPIESNDTEASTS